MATSELRFAIKPSLDRVGTGRRRYARARSALEPARRRLAHLHRAGSRVRRPNRERTASSPRPRRCPTASRFRLDQHGAGEERISPPRPGDAIDAPGDGRTRARRPHPHPRCHARRSCRLSQARLRRLLGLCTAAPPRAATRGRQPSSARRDVAVRAIVDQDWPALCAYDAAAFGADRSAVLAGLRGRLARRRARRRARGPHRRLRARPRRRAGGASRPVDCGRRGHRGRASRARARGRSKVRCSSISPTASRSCAASSTRAASPPVRPFTRMLYGSSTRFDDPARTFAVIGPEFG